MFEMKSIPKPHPNAGPTGASSDKVIQRRASHAALRSRDEPLVDVTAEAQATEMSALAFDAVPLPVVVAGFNSGIILNAAARELLGATPPSSVADHYEKLRARNTEGSPLADGDSPLARALTGECVSAMKLRIAAGLVAQNDQGKDPECERLWLADARPLRHEGAIIGAVCTYRDITECSLDDDMADDLLGTAAHDLRTPLTALKASAQLISRGLERLETTARERTLKMLLGQVDKLAGKIDDVVDAARIRRGRLDVTPVNVDLTTTLTDIVDEVRKLQGGPACQTRIATGLRALADPLRLRQVVRRLILEAGERSGANGPPVVIEASSSPEGVTIVVDVQSGSTSARSRYARRLARAVITRLGGATTDEVIGSRRSVRMSLPLPPPDDLPPR
ncbi:MAG: hypothetical protein NVS3B20_02140 [Polyangiales bacterium]